jgi:hypothetical protein
MQASSFWWFLSLCGHRGSRTLELNKITCERCRVLNSLYQSGMRRKAREAEAFYQGHRGRRNIGEIAGTTSANLGDRLRSRAIKARPDMQRMLALGGHQLTDAFGDASDRPDGRCS